MGCRKSRTIYSTVSTENQEVIRFENTWNLQKISFQELEAVYRRSTTAPLSKIISLLNQNFSIQIPQDLSESIEVPYETFLSFLILTGKGSVKDKNSALWYAFDKNLEGKISKASFRQLLKSVINASIDISIKYFLTKSNSPLITSWAQQFKERTESLEIKLAKHFLEENDSISFEVFVAKCAEMPLGMICSVSAIRTQLEHTQVIPNRFANPFKTMKITKLTS